MSAELGTRNAGGDVGVLSPEVMGAIFDGADGADGAPAVRCEGMLRPWLVRDELGWRVEWAAEVQVGGTF